MGTFKVPIPKSQNSLPIDGVPWISVVCRPEERRTYSVVWQSVLISRGVPRAARHSAHWQPARSGASESTVHVGCSSAGVALHSRSPGFTPSTTHSTVPMSGTHRSIAHGVPAGSRAAEQWCTRPHTMSNLAPTDHHRMLDSIAESRSILGPISSKSSQTDSGGPRNHWGCVHGRRGS